MGNKILINLMWKQKYLSKLVVTLLISYVSGSYNIHTPSRYIREKHESANVEKMLRVQNNENELIKLKFIVWIIENMKLNRSACWKHIFHGSTVWIGLKP